MSVTGKPLPIEIERIRIELAGMEINDAFKEELDRVLVFAFTQSKSKRFGTECQFGRFMVELRKKADRTQEFVAKKVNLRRQTIDAIEHGRALPPSRYYITKWLRSLDAFSELKEALRLLEISKSIRDEKRRQAARTSGREFRKIQLLKQQQQS